MVDKPTANGLTLHRGIRGNFRLNGITLITKKCQIKLRIPSYISYGTKKRKQTMKRQKKNKSNLFSLNGDAKLST